MILIVVNLKIIKYLFLKRDLHNNLGVYLEICISNNIKMKL